MEHKAEDIKNQLAQAAMIHVAFDGWTDDTLRAACQDCGIDPDLARLHLPRGGLDLAIWAHKMGDHALVDAIRDADLSDLKFREKITWAVRKRIEIAQDKEAVRRATSLFALPQNATIGTSLIWGTCDVIWSQLGDTSTDYNWYTKRATLSAVYGSTVLYWLGDTSQDDQDTWDYLDRRIADVMQFEKFKAQMRSNQAVSRLMAGPKWLLDRVKAPSTNHSNRPGIWARSKDS